MELKDKNIGFALTGSFCCFKNIIKQVEEIKNLGGNVIPIMSFSAFVSDTRFGNADSFVEELEKITKNKVICSLQRAEEIGLNKETDILVVAPVTRQYISKTC